MEEPASLHKYLYCHADPVNGIDPSGHFTLKETLIVGGKIGMFAARVAAPTLSARSFLTRMVYGSATSAAIIIYATEYLPPTVEELDKLASACGAHNDVALATMAIEAAQEGRELYAELLMKNSVRPFLQAQLGALVNGYTTYSNGKEINNFVDRVNATIAFGATAIGAPFLFHIDKQKTLGTVLKFNATPDSDVESFRYLYEAKKRGDKAGAEVYTSELTRSLEKYGTVTRVIQ